MLELAEKLGLDWKLLLSQAVNFLVLLALLRQFAYKPLLKILKERRTKSKKAWPKPKKRKLACSKWTVSPRTR